MPRVISPPRSDLDSLRQPLEEGERLVLDFFDTNLPEKWEIYIQPHLNGLRPDFVLLHPEVGIAVFEVKNWNLDALEYWVDEPEGKAPILKARGSGRTFSRQKQNPVDQVFRYRQEIHDLYCPRLDHRAGSVVITAGVIFPSADDERVLELLRPSLRYRKMEPWPKYNPISGRSALDGADLSRVFPEAGRVKSIYMSPAAAADLRLWLVEPDASLTQRTPLELDEAQRNLVNSRTATGFRRITGPAGSGKSIVLAARAAQLVSEGKDVLVITFNLTLLNYLADAAVRRFPAARKRATWLNFHGWCKRICEQTGHELEYKALWRGAGFPSDQPLCDLMESILDGDSEGEIERYDAVLVDEGQDFHPDWWKLLRKIRRPGGEMWLAADATQDVYGRASAWTDGAMLGAGFSGNWATLKTSYRLPSGMLEHVQVFGKRFLPGESADLPVGRQLELDLFPCMLRWVQTQPEKVVDVTEREIWDLLKQSDEHSLSVSDLTVLVPTKVLGMQLEKLLAHKAVRCLSTFDRDEGRARRKKLAFFMGDAKIKLTTLHSFKGWETRALLICIGRATSAKDMALVYTGLTRLKAHVQGSFVTVVCGEPSLMGYGKSWPEFLSIGHVSEGGSLESVTS